MKKFLILIVFENENKLYFESRTYNFHNYVHLIYPDELEIKDTTESDRCASYLDILLNIESNGRLTTTL